MGHSHPRILAIGLALSVALGLLLMHGLDSDAAAAGHGRAAAPALISEIRDAATSADEAVFRPGTQPGHAMAGLCIAVLAAGLVLLLRVVSIRRTRSARAHRQCSACVGSVAAPWSRRAPPPPPRVALCVSLS